MTLPSLLGLVAALLVVLAVLAWWFVLRVGRRLSATADSGPIEVADAKEYARRALTEPGPRHADLARLWAPSTAADVEVLPEGRVFYPRMLEDVRGARHSVHIMQYGFQPGVIGDQFVPLFSEKARNGVAVRLVVDALGSHAYTGSKAMFNTLAAAGVETMLHDLIPPDRRGHVGTRRLTSRLWQTGRVEHRKLVLVDGATAYVGGAGLEDHFFDGRFHDVYVRFTGPVTRQLQAIFLATFSYHGGRLPTGEGVLDGYFPPISEEGPHAVNVIMNWPRGWLPLTDAAIELLRTAERRLDIMNYYIGDARVISEILAAARRGVRVRLVIADQAHANGVTYGAFLHHYDGLLAAGVEIWEYPAVVHAKVIVSDDRALVGTLNLDAFALYRNPEMGLRFDDQVVADRFVSTLFEPDIAMSVPGRRASGRFRRIRNRVFSTGNYFY
jgi:cardiolipin synthase